MEDPLKLHQCRQVWSLPKAAGKLTGLDSGNVECQWTEGRWVSSITPKSGVTSYFCLMSLLFNLARHSKTAFFSENHAKFLHMSSNCLKYFTLLFWCRFFSTGWIVHLSIIPQCSKLQDLVQNVLRISCVSTKSLPHNHYAAVLLASKRIWLGLSQHKSPVGWAISTWSYILPEQALAKCMCSHVNTAVLL